MPDRRPLVVINGVLSEMPTGDRLTGLPPAIAAGQPYVFEQGPIDMPGPLYRPGSDVTIAPVAATPNTTAQIAATLRAFPWRINKAISISQVRAEVTTLLAGATFRLALYADNGSAYPGAIIAGSDVGALDAATTGIKLNAFASNIALSPGLYWLAINNSGTPTLRTIAASFLDPVLGSSAGGGANANYSGWAIAQAFGALPATFPAGATLLANASAPMAMFRLA